MVANLKEEEGGGDWTIYVTGHSLGGALATICAADLKVLFPNVRIFVGFLA